MCFILYAYCVHLYTVKGFSFLNIGKQAFGHWSKEGCWEVNSTSNNSSEFVTCECNHLTNFAIIFTTAKTLPAANLGLDLISYIGCGLSILSLSATLLVYCSIKYVSILFVQEGIL